MAKAKAKGKAGGGWRGRLTRTLAGGLTERAQLLELLREATKRGLVDTDAMAMVEGALTMAELQARDLMVIDGAPEPDVVAGQLVGPQARQLQEAAERFPGEQGTKLAHKVLVRSRVAIRSG